MKLITKKPHPLFSGFKAVTLTVEVLQYCGDGRIPVSSEPGLTTDLCQVSFLAFDFFPKRCLFELLAFIFV